MIRVRDDDCLVTSSSWPDPFKRFRRVHNWISEIPNEMIHVPAILCTEIQQFPDCVKYIKNETRASRMLPELHGFQHEIDYRNRSYEDCCADLEKSIEWMATNLDVIPTVWYTPRCASHQPMKEAAARYGLEFVDTFKNPLEGRNGVVQFLKDGGQLPKDAEPGRYHATRGTCFEISMHWWSYGLRLKRVVEVIKHGSWAKAAELNKELFNG